MKTLFNLSVGEFAVIKELNGSDSLIRKMSSLGLIPGTSIQLIRRAPLGDPIEIQVRHYILSLRREEAEMVIVHETSDLHA